jgi:predicted dienelactone hydrolase
MGSLDSQPPPVGPGGETAAPADPFMRPGPSLVATLFLEWEDLRRHRRVPAKIYFPSSDPGPLPAIIFSHGTGGSRGGYAYLGMHWASHGYVAVHVQHLGSDQAVWQNQADPRESMRRAAQDPDNMENRPRDVSFAIDALDSLNRGAGPLAGRLDLGRIGVAGHSFGAYTALAVAGMLGVGPDGRELSLADSRVKAAIAMSPPAPRRPGLAGAIYAPIHIPCLHMTGTRDESPLGLTAVADRRVPFDHIRGADQYLLIFSGGDHMTFADRRRPGHSGQDWPPFHDLVRASSTAFWDTYLKGTAAARAWLGGGPLAALLGPRGTLETKLAPDKAESS